MTWAVDRAAAPLEVMMQPGPKGYGLPDGAKIRVDDCLVN
jgi:hypothetical protein